VIVAFSIILNIVSTVTPKSFVKDLREGLSMINQLNEDTDPGKPLQAIIENCMRAIDFSMRRASSCMESIALEILEVNQGRPVNEQWLNEKVDMEIAFKTIEHDLSRVEMYAERAGFSVKKKSGEIIDFSEPQIRTTCHLNDSYIEVNGDFIKAFIEEGIWLKPNNNPQYATASFREKYLKLTDAVTSVYTLCIALLNKYYNINKIENKAMEIIPATKNICGKLLIDGASGDTATKPPFITESMFNTGK